MNIAITHATRRGAKAVKTKESWLNNAAQPSNIQYTFAVDEDDLISLEATEGHQRVICKPGIGCNACVNAGARHAGGDLIMVIADDLESFECWDAQLFEKVGSIVNKFPFVVHCSDGLRRDNLITHPVINYLRFQQFDYRIFLDEFKTVFGDSDFSLRTYQDCIDGKCSVIQARELIFKHKHPFGGGGEMDEQYTKQNADYASGFVLMEKFNPTARQPFIEKIIYA